MNSGKAHIFGLLLCATFHVVPASAAPEDAPPTSESFFQRGRAAMNEGRFDAARTYFEQSQKLEPALGTLLNLAVCEEKLGRLVSALERLEQALAQSAPTDRRRPLIESRIAELDKRTPRLTVRTEGELGSDVTIVLDEVRLGRGDWGKKLRVDPGPHKLDCAGQHVEACAQMFNLAEGEQVEKVISVPSPAATRVSPAAPVAAKESRSEAPAMSSGSSRPASGYVLGVVGLAAVAGGLVAGAAVIHQKSVFHAHCDSTGCDPEGMSAADSGKTLSLVSTVSVAVGIAALGTSAYLLLAVPAGKNNMSSILVSGSF